MKKRKLEDEKYDLKNGKRYRASCLNIEPTPTSALRPNNKINLFAMCLDFIAENIDAVESFRGFPSLVGEIIFKRCLDLNKFTQVSNLALFVAAYPDLICPSIDLSHRDLFNYQHLLDVIAPCHISELNLDGSDLVSSGLGLFEFLRSSSHVLRYLSLRSNNLNDNYIRKSTLPVRMGLVRFECLRYINLSNNKRLTSACLVNFDKFGSLNEVLVDFKNTTGLMRVCKCPANKSVVISSSGWMANLDLSELERFESGFFKI